MSGLIRLRLEPRTAMMAMAEIVWEDQPGTWRGSFAKLEDTSPSGACIRVATAIAVGAKLKVKWHKEQFSGIAKYCRREGGEYILGIQRESSEEQARTLELVQRATANSTARPATSLQEGSSKLPAPAAAKIPDAPARLEYEEIKAPRVIPKPEPAPVRALHVPVAVPIPTAALPASAAVKVVPVPVPPPFTPIPIAMPAAVPVPATPKPASLPLPLSVTSIPAAKPAPPLVPALKVAQASSATGNGKHAGAPGLPLPQVSNTNRSIELPAQGPSQGPERTLVLSKLLHLGGGPGRNQQNSPDGDQTSMKGKTNVAEPRPSPANPNVTNARAPAPAAARVTTPAIHQGKLLPLQDIYLAVGIMSARLGYSIDTVSTMLDSEHLRGLSSEVKKASVLMALEAAGIPVEDLLADGAQRLDALNEYEAGERKHFEEYEARKAQESAQIQAEIERMTAHCMSRIQNNHGEVASAKHALDEWQAKKQIEAQRITDAVALFGQSSATDRLRDSQPALEEVGAPSKR